MHLLHVTTGKNVKRVAVAYADLVQREILWVFERFPVFVPGQTNAAVSPAKLPTRTTSATSLGRSHEQRFALLTVLALEMTRGAN